MPLKGFTCCQTGMPSEFAPCLSKSRKGECSYPLPLLTYIATPNESRKGIAVSATELTGCARQYNLKQEVDFYETPESYSSRFGGSAHHEFIGSMGPHEGVIEEQRISATFGDVLVSGQPDWVDTSNAHLIDWKRTASIPKEPYESHVWQVNIYVELLERNGIPIETADIWYCDGKRWRRREVPIWSQAGRVQFIHNRLRAIKANERLPEFPDHYMCRSCPVFEQCERIGDNP